MRRGNSRSLVGWLNLACALSIFVSAAALAADTPASDPAPKLLINEATFDFGSVAQGQEITHDYTIKNSGTAELSIQRIVPSCGCTIANSSSSLLPAGGEGKISVQFDTSGFSGDKTKIVRVYSNDPDSPVQDIVLKGRVEPDVQIEPRTVFLGEVVAGSEGPGPRQIVSLSLKDGAKLKITGFKTFSRYLKVEEVESGARHRRIAVSLDPSVPAGDFRDRVVVELDGGADKTVNLPVFASVRENLRFTPPRLSFGVIEGQAAIERRAKLEYLGTGRLTIKSISSDSAAVKAELKTVEEGRSYVVRVSVDPASLQAEELRANVQITVDRPGAGETTLSLGVYGIKPPRI